MNPNSATRWLPLIEKAGLPTPRTIMIPYDHAAIAPIFDGERSLEMECLLKVTQEVARRIGYPVFIRTDLASAKHSGPTAYRATDDMSVPAAMYSTLEDNEMKFWISPYGGPSHVMVREFLELESHFTAFRGLPISREWRFFADGAEVKCAHPYWPADAIEDHLGGDTPENWRDLLRDLHSEPKEMPALREMAVRAAVAQGGGEWSVDFCRDVKGKWWLLDMATAKDSFHWDGCVRGKEWE